MTEDVEVWRVVACAPHYEVSSHGRVRNVDRTIVTSNGQSRRYRGGIISPCKNQRGHLKVLLLIAPGVKIARYVHSLVAEAFIGPRPEGTEVAHRDGNPANNRKGNIRYATPKENAADKIIHGTHMEGEGHPCAILSAQDVLEIRSRLSSGELQRDIAAKFGVARTTIGAISTGRSWSCLSDARHSGGPKFIGAPEREPA